MFYLDCRLLVVIIVLLSHKVDQTTQSLNVLSPVPDLYCHFIRPHDRNFFFLILYPFLLHMGRIVTLFLWLAPVWVKFRSKTWIWLNFEENQLPNQVCLNRVLAVIFLIMLFDILVLKHKL